MNILLFFGTLVNSTIIIPAGPCGVIIGLCLIGALVSGTLAMLAVLQQEDKNLRHAKSKRVEDILAQARNIESEFAV